MTTIIIGPTIGRPSKYSDAIQEKADEYFYHFDYDGDVIPTAAGLAIYLGVNKSTLYEWAGKYKDFSDSLERLNGLQEKLTVNKSLIGDFNPAVSKLILHNHGYSERQEIDMSSSDGTMATQLDPSKLSKETLKELLDAASETVKG